jgi:hypothetical protein
MVEDVPSSQTTSVCLVELPAKGGGKSKAFEIGR